MSRYLRARMTASAPKIGFVSLGCPKALVDSERILTRLRGEGYATSDTHEGADAVVVNTCGFLDSARDESLEAIGEAIAKNGRVIVTGCLGAEAELIRERFPQVESITGPARYDEVMEAVHRLTPPPAAFTDVVPDAGVKLTPRHYAYLKISEGCMHRCSFCIIPQMRGDLVSRPVDEVLREAETLVENGVKEILVVSQDTSAFGLDRRYAPGEWRGRERAGDLEGLARGLGELGAWVRLHYVYPYPHVDRVIPLMAEGKLLPYLDIPFQHASPTVLKAMRRPGNQTKTLERIGRWREIAPDLVLRSTFVLGFPGETEADFDYLLEWLEEARLDRVGAFKYENVAGASARDLPDHVPEAVKQERWERFMAKASAISRDKLRAKVGRSIRVLVDAVRPDGVAVARSAADAPEIDGEFFVRNGRTLKPGDFAEVKVERTADYDLWAALASSQTLSAPPRRLHRVIARV
ncbi:MAG: 30S ribosomal protein S12 methylthiotransferase RimO [Pseudomonadota bacterium]|nr:30S ribosomal protein S12 methylthiotransferase RimO [Pseudomonadota bacterium]